MAAIYSLYIINKSGGLIFYKDYGSAGRMDTNDSLRVASLWHSMHAISQQLSPISGCSGTELLEADTFDLHCFQSLTGTKFFVVCEPGTLHMEGLLKYIYELYTDYVLKNPFYEMEMPIRCELFDINLVQAVQKDRIDGYKRELREVSRDGTGNVTKDSLAAERIGGFIANGGQISMEDSMRRENG
ncbi:Trafficking protein particle complex subunit 4 [Cucurbita argyrosperma subsp. argyrosperma]|nr:Trafficking protein particle complex subunit 4 [Cucurbita argyrosperma subsp. argyrosperma]